MNGISASDLRYCENIACEPGSVFSASYGFARSSFRTRLLMVWALLTEIRSIPFTVSDPGVAGIKLAWWRNELVKSGTEECQHPLVLLLAQTKTLEHLNRKLLEQFFSGVTSLVSGEPINSAEQLKNISRDVGGSAWLIQAEMGGYQDNSNLVQEAGAAWFIGSLLQNIDKVIPNETWWMPLDIQARLGITYSSVRNEESRDKLLESVRLLAGQALDLMTDSQFLQKRKRKSLQSDGVHFLRIMMGMTKRQLDKMVSNPEHSRSGKVGLREIFAAWRLAVIG